MGFIVRDAQLGMNTVSSRERREDEMKTDGMIKELSLCILEFVIIRMTFPVHLQQSDQNAGAESSHTKTDTRL